METTSVKILPFTIREFMSEWNVPQDEVEEEYLKYLDFNKRHHHYNDMNIAEWYVHQVESLGYLLTLDNPHNIHDEFQEGKYKGSKVIDIFIKDIKYIVWLYRYKNFSIIQKNADEAIKSIMGVMNGK